MLLLQSSALQVPDGFLSALCFQSNSKQVEEGTSYSTTIFLKIKLNKKLQILVQKKTWRLGSGNLKQRHIMKCAVSNRVLLLSFKTSSE